MKNTRAQHSSFTTPLITRRQAIEITLAASAITLASACSSPSAAASTGTSGSSTGQPKPSGTAVNATLTVSATAVGSISPAFAGLSYEKATLYEPLFTGSNANLIGLFKRLGSSVLRIGGNTVDHNVWTPAGTGQTAGQIAPADVDALAAFLQATGWQCLYGVNLGGSGTAPYTSGSITAATTPALAAQEAAYVASKLGSSLLGIEIGNEPDLYGRTFYPGGTWNLAAFEAVWDRFRTAILAQTPGVAITGPADASNESKWTVPFGQWATKSKISLLTQHYYRGNGKSATSTAANLITPDTNLINDLAIVNTAAQAIGVPYRLAECNSYYHGGSSGVSDSYASSLWVLDYLFDCALGGASGVNFHGGGSGSGYTPIADSGGTIIEARPEYYGILLFNLAGQGDLLTTTLNAASLNATAYAVKAASGNLNLIVVNKDRASNLSLSIQLPQSASSATLIELAQTSASLTATSGVTIQGANVAANGSFTPDAAYTLATGGTHLTCYVPALSAVLIQIS
jgi:hypothetical protein